MAYQLVVLRGRSASQALRLGPGVTTVGRHEECQLRIRSSQVSRKHCQLFEKKGLLIVKDLGSSNGTLVNGKKIDDQRVLEPGDELGIGPVKLKLSKIEAPAAPKPGDTAVGAASDSVEPTDLLEITMDEDDGATKAVAVSPLPAKPVAAAKPAPPKSPATRPAPPKPTPNDEPEEIGEDAVAEFLMNIDLDDEDKL